MRVYNKEHPSELTFTDEVNGEYNITHNLTDVDDDYIATALMLFKVGEITLDEAACYFGGEEYQEGYSRSDKVYNHKQVAKLVREATSTMEYWGES